jgi:hypothetical protein
MRASDLQPGDLIGSLEVVQVIPVTTSTSKRVLVSTADGAEFDFAANEFVGASPRY